MKYQAQDSMCLRIWGAGPLGMIPTPSFQGTLSRPEPCGVDAAISTTTCPRLYKSGLDIVDSLIFKLLGNLEHV